MKEKEGIEINYTRSYARQRINKRNIMYYSYTGYSIQKDNLVKRRLRALKKQIDKKLG